MKSIMSDDSDYQRTVRYSTVESYARCSEKHAKSFFPMLDSFAEQRGSDGRFQRAVLDRAKPLTVVL